MPLNSIQESVEAISPWFKVSEEEILSRFANLPNAQVLGEGDFRSVFVPGTRRDRVLLVAHSDTVWLDHPSISVGLNDEGIFHSLNRVRKLVKYKHRKGVFPVLKGTGIGADDRAGVALLWEYRNSGHSLIVTSCEENGGWGAAYAVANEDNARMINSHQFAIEFDRRDFNDLVFYNVGTKAFKSYCEAQTHYTEANGTWSDIVLLCQTMCGVNISVGYRNEHTCSEFLNVHWWFNTYRTVGNWLNQFYLSQFRKRHP